MGYEASWCDGCSCSGLAVTCTSTDADSPWNGFSSDTDHWKAAGSDSGDFNGVEMSGVCTSTSGFYLPSGGDYTKIWPSNGNHYARFQGSPYNDLKTFCVLDLQEEV